MISYNPIIQNLNSKLFTDLQLSVDVLRLDLIDSEVGGNKWFKLKKNIKKARQDEQRTVITFGGAHSNHIASTAAACKTLKLNAIAVIRGEEPPILSPTLQIAKEKGMQFYFVDRETYSKKDTAEFKKHLSQKFGPHYLIPEGGNNREGILGCAEILRPEWDHDLIFCACGTGATFTGIVGSAKPTQKVIGISVLKGENKLQEETKPQLKTIFPDKQFSIKGNEELEKAQIENNCITNNYCFSGYAKMDKELVDFKNKFEEEFNIPLDHIYTSKLFYAVFDLIRLKKIKVGSKLLIIHSGGLQGNKGFEERYKL